MAARKQQSASRFCLELAAVSKSYGRGSHRVVALSEVSVAFPRGSFTAVMGPSGSGKSTLLHCAAGLDSPETGSVRLGGTEIAGLTEPRLTRLRRERVGFVFQSFNLVASLNVQDNITLPLRLAGHRPDRARLAEVVGRVGLTDRLRHRPAQLSGGQQQRVAVARALLGRPEVLFADEPTGALDPSTGMAVLRLLRSAVDQVGQSVVMVTHDTAAACFADTVVFLADGRLAGALEKPTQTQIAERMARLQGVPL